MTTENAPRPDSGDAPGLAAAEASGLAAGTAPPLAVSGVPPLAGGGVLPPAAGTWLRLPAAGGTWARRTIVAAALIAYSWFAGATVPFTRSSLLVVLVPGAVAGVIAYGRPPRRIPAPDRLDLTGSSCWLIAIAAVVEWEASAFRDFTPFSHPPLSDLINPLLTVHPVKAAAVLTWLLAGWALLRR